MAIINSGFLVDNPMDLTEPLEKLIKVGFGLARDEPVEDIDVEIDDEEEEAEDDSQSGSETNAVDEDQEEQEVVNEEL